MKRTICILLIAVLLLGVPAACAKKDSVAAFKQANEIVTYAKLDPERTQIVVSRTGNIEVENFCKKFEAKNPDVQVVYLDITGGLKNAVPAVDWVKNGYAPDVMITTSGFFSDEEIAALFENLSANPIIANYETDALKRTATDGNIYWLPGPSNIGAMMYNKTLFAQYGWEVPTSFDEFITLCNQIRTDTDGAVEPWNPNAKYDNELRTVLEGFVYEEVFGGADNRAWYNDFVAGSETFSGHMEPYFDAIETLVENGLLREEHFSYSATARGKEFAAGQIAMLNMVISDYDNDMFDFGYMPFPTTVGALGYICDSYSCFIGVPKRERTQEAQDAVARFIEYFSTPEGQQDFMGNAMKVSNVKNVPLNQSDDLATLQPVIDEGHTFGVIDFAGVNVGLDPYVAALQITQGTITGAECIAIVDAAPRAPEAAAPPEPLEIVAAVEKELTVLETSFFIADMYRETADADIGLIANNAVYRGNLMRIFEGDFTATDLIALKPRSFANDAALIKVAMTGQQIVDAMNQPVGNNSIADCIYAYSGLKCKVAPWNTLGERYLSVELADGTALDLTKTYQVACWAGTIADAYISETLETYEGTWEDLMKAKMQKESVIRPANDGRITLVWD